MAKDMSTSSDTGTDLRDIGNNAEKPVDSKLASHDGVDLNAGGASSADGARGGPAKALPYEAPPPNYNEHANLRDTPPAYVIPAPEHLGRPPEQNLEDWLAGARDGASEWATAAQDRRDREAQIEGIDASNRAHAEAGAKGIESQQEQENTEPK
jgi:hypothetical protein